MLREKLYLIEDPNNKHKPVYMQVQHTSMGVKVYLYDEKPTRETEFLADVIVEARVEGERGTTYITAHLWEDETDKTEGATEIRTLAVYNRKEQAPLDPSVRDFLVAIQCPKERQLAVELEFKNTLGWSVDDFGPGLTEPDTHVTLIMNPHTDAWFSDMSKKLNALQTREMITSWEKYHASDVEGLEE